MNRQSDSHQNMSFLALLTGLGMVIFAVLWELRWRRLLQTMSSRQKSTSEWVERALHDPLTSLPNRSLLNDRIDQALIRSQPMDWLIRKATELGVNTIQPVLTERCVARTRERPERWQRTVVSAAEQCGAVWMPEIRPVRTWTEWCATLPAAEHRVIGALLDSPPPLRHVLRNWQAPRRIEVWIGPEGDFTAAEIEAALAGGVEPASFGPLVMRVETAALFALAAIRYEWGGSPAGSVDLPAAEGYI